jgi:hypothetical protein
MSAEHGNKPGPQIFINGKPHKAPKDEMTGAELKVLGGIADGNKLFKEEPGSHPDTPIADSASVVLKNGDKFYDLPPGVVGRSCFPR